jgi:hypothetical protein
MHLKHIAKMFAEGNFNAPMLIHDQTPPGVPVMQELKGEIEYKYEEIDRKDFNQESECLESDS